MEFKKTATKNSVTSEKCTSKNLNNAEAFVNISYKLKAQIKFYSEVC